jgi:hypothetical protein
MSNEEAALPRRFFFASLSISSGGYAMQGQTIVFEAPGSWGVYARRELEGVALKVRSDRFGEQWVLVQCDRLKAPRWVHHTFLKTTTAAMDTTAAV